MNGEKKCTVILEGTFNEGGMKTKEFEEYSRRSNANGEANGGVVLSKYVIEQNLGNGNTPNFILVVEYPSHEIAVDTFSNSEYKSIIPLRDVAFKEVNILITKSGD
ncbi:MAG: DUF1330 domain-containing protein [Candidatus Marinimicrobia bacterium]|nr:DUF1330 domain-containing protein [Candidatus Neomarinimicrobiota bacterium]